MALRDLRYCTAVRHIVGTEEFHAGVFSSMNCMYCVEIPSWMGDIVQRDLEHERERAKFHLALLARPDEDAGEAWDEEIFEEDEPPSFLAIDLDKDLSEHYPDVFAFDVSSGREDMISYLPHFSIPLLDEHDGEAVWLDLDTYNEMTLGERIWFWIDFAPNPDFRETLDEYGPSSLVNDLSAASALAPGTVRRILEGLTESPRPDTIKRIATSLGVPVEALTAQIS